MSALFHQTLWTDGNFRCVLVRRETAPHLAVQAFHFDQAILTERCGTPDEAARIAEQFWVALIEPLAR